MSLSILVTNQPPAIDNNVPQPLLERFQEYTRQTQNGQVFPLFQHQAEAFRLVEADQEVFLVAGTAAGKTLAIAVPLFHKLETRRIRRVLLMYPTIALMEDQRRVMDALAALTGLEIGHIQGGMSRTELIAALNKPVILATPDAVYWFFHKNVKYSSLLIYGLALVDEFVLDEAHLFNGLMLQSLWHLKQRVQLLGERLSKRSRWHILTATPTPELQNLTQGREVQGQSKCGDVTVAFQEPVKRDSDYPHQIIGVANNALADGSQKVLVVFNSADLAHRVFEEIRGGQCVELPPELLWQFGLVRWSEFEQWLEKEAVEAETVTEIKDWLQQQYPLYLKDLHSRAQATLPNEMLMSRVSRLLEDYRVMFSRLLSLAAKDDSRGLLEAIEAQMRETRGAPRLLWDAINTSTSPVARYKEIVSALDTWIEDVITKLERTCVNESLTLTAPSFPEIRQALQDAGVGSALVQRIVETLRYTMELSGQDAAHSAISTHALVKRQIGLSWLSQVIQEQSRYDALALRIRMALETGQLHVEAQHIATWGHMGVPVIIYTGKMTKAERNGLIEAFALLPQAILISTPAVEVGVDFAADTLITEECDGNAFLQRFGRVGRRTGIHGNVIVFVRNGEVYVKLHKQHQPHLSRQAFSDLIANPVTGIFPHRTYTESSFYVEVIHWLVNRQVGEIGRWLNQEMFGQEVMEFAQKLQRADLGFSYGLRGTLPSISLQGGASGDPFYILRKVENEQLILSDSPFEMARSEMTYTEFLWKRPSWKAITVDTQATLESSRTLFWWSGGRWHLQAGYGIVADFTRLFNPAPVSKGRPLRELLRPVEQQIRHDLEGFLLPLRSQKSGPLPRLLLRVGEALRLFYEPHAQFLLGQGDVHLGRLDPDGLVVRVEDYLGNALVLPEQSWLLLYGYEQKEAIRLLKSVSAMNLEEVVYLWSSLEMYNNHGLLLLDRTAGACFAVYQRLVAYVNGKI